MPHHFVLHQRIKSDHFVASHAQSAVLSDQAFNFAPFLLLHYFYNPYMTLSADKQAQFILRLHFIN